ncbi:MAG: OsmC family protein [Litorimonas sp.]
MAEPILVKERLGGKYTQAVSTTRDHHFFADEPVSYGSSDLGPSPFELVSAGLGACTNMTMRMYIERKGWSVDHLEVKVSHKKVAGGDQPPRDVFVREITIQGDVDDAQRARILEIANKCPVHKTLEASSHVETKLNA